jgi:hypothetical protein
MSEKPPAKKIPRLIELGRPAAILAEPRQAFWSRLMSREARKVDLRASLQGIARALRNFLGHASEAPLPEKLATLLKRLSTASGHQDRSPPNQTQQNKD